MGGGGEARRGSGPPLPLELLLFSTSHTYPKNQIISISRTPRPLGLILSTHVCPTLNHLQLWASGIDIERPWKKDETHLFHNCHLSSPSSPFPPFFSPLRPRRFNWLIRPKGGGGGHVRNTFQRQARSVSESCNNTCLEEQASLCELIVRH